MQTLSAVLAAHLRTAVLAIVALAVVAVPAAPADAREQSVAMASAGWHGRAIQDPQPRPRLAGAQWPKGWSAGPVARGDGYVRAGGSRRVRDLQQRLRQLGYRPGPADGLFGPRTEAATRWFQYKHGLAITGRVSRATLAVLYARSEHRPLRRPQPETAEERPDRPAPPTTTATGEDSGTNPLVVVLAVLLALAIGVIVGTHLPHPRRRREAEAPEPQSAAPAPKSNTPVFGYVTVGAGVDAEAAMTALAHTCEKRGWSLLRVIHDGEPASGRIADRDGLMYALRAIGSGRASGLVLARVEDFAPRLANLAALLQWLEEADGFLAAADHPLDTSTGTGRATADAIIDLARWERVHAGGRFQRDDPELAPRIAAMRDRGIPLGAIADALSLAGVPTPEGGTEWHAGSVKATIARELDRRT